MNLLKFSDYPISTLEALNVSVTGIVVVMIVLAVLAVLVVLLSKSIRTVESKAKKSNSKEENKTEVKAEAVVVNTTPTAKSGVALPENESAGNLHLYRTDEKTAAIIMSIVSNKSGIPLNKLQFNSIKLIEE